MSIFEGGLTTCLSREQIDRIQSKQIGIAGAGGLGSNVAAMLARSGFRKFVVMDFDTVEPANLNRQFFFLEDVGKPKAGALAARLRSINPNIVCDCHDTAWHPTLAVDPFLPCDILIEAFDKAETKAAFINHYSDKAPYIVSGNGMAGISGPPLSVHRHGNVFIIGDEQTEAGDRHPPMAPRVTVCAAMMAEIVLKVVLEI